MAVSIRLPMTMAAYMVIGMTMMFTSHAFTTPSLSKRQFSPTTTTSSTQLHMGLDLVTYLRTEFISAALCTNQTPRSADVALQLGTDDGRPITFLPRTIRAFVTSSAEKDGRLTVTARRQLKQQAERRGTGVEIRYCDQAADDLSETEDESVDVVLSLQAAERMRENGLDWKASVREAARVLKPGGRFLFVEQTELKGENYMDYLQNLGTKTEGEEDVFPVFSEIGTDDVDLVLVPHVAGVAVKAEDSGLTKQEREEKQKKEEQAKYAELSITAFERGSKKKRKKKKKNTDAEEIEG